MLMPALGGSEPDGLALATLGSLSHQKDTTWTKLFVGGLPYHTTDKSLREHFAVYGEIEEAVVITDRQTSKSRGYGFVIMGDRSSAERACKEPNPIIDGRKANVNLAILGAKPRGNITQGIRTPDLITDTQARYSLDHGLGFPFTAGIRTTGYPTVLPSQYGIPPGYMYQHPAYVAQGGLVQLPAATQLSHAALAAAASQFYEYQSAAAAAAATAAAYPGQAAAAAAYGNGFDTYPYTSSAAAAGAAASYMPPYATYATLPQAALPAGSVLPGLSPYPQSQPALQEARMQ